MKIFVSKSLNNDVRIASIFYYCLDKVHFYTNYNEFDESFKNTITYKETLK